MAKRGGPGRCEGISLAEIMRCPPTTCTLDGHLRVNRRKEQKASGAFPGPWPLDLGPQLLRAVTLAVEDLPRTARAHVCARGGGAPVDRSASVQQTEPAVWSATQATCTEDKLVSNMCK